MSFFAMILASLALVATFALPARPHIAANGSVSHDQERPLDAMLLELPVCTPPNGTFEIEVFYTGKDPDGFNIATTAIGQDADAPEVYHLNLKASELNQTVRRQGCFERNSLQRFVVFEENPQSPKPEGTYYSLFVNGEMVAHEENVSSDVVFTEYYFVGDQENCLTDEFRFTLEILFDLWPDETTWQLSQLKDDIGSYEVIFTSDSTLKAGALSYSSEFDKTMLFIDRCIKEGSYKFEFKDSGSDMIEAPGYYRIAANDSVIASGMSSCCIETHTFTLDGTPDAPTPAPPTPAPPTPAPFSMRDTRPPGAPVRATTAAAPTSVGSVGILPPTVKPQGPKSPTSAPEPPRTKIAWCFSSLTTVHVRDKGLTEMQNLQIGDMIAVDKSGIFEPIYSFGHYEPNGQAELLEIHTNCSAIPALQISLHHLIFVVNEVSGSLVAVPAASIKVGDSIVYVGVPQHDTAVVVKSIKSVLITDGLYSPFTPSGKLLVNDGLLASCFVALDETTPVMRMGGIDFSYHWIAHTFEFPHRVACCYLGLCPTETYNEAGLSKWMAIPLKVASSVLGIESVIVKELVLLIILCFLLMFALLDVLGVHVWLIIVTSFFLWRATAQSISSCSITHARKM